MEVLIKEYESITTLEQDLEFLNDKEMPLSENQRYFVVLRSEKKKILHSQLYLAQYLLKLVKKCTKLRDLALADKKAAAEQFKEAYLVLMDDETENRDEVAE